MLLCNFSGDFLIIILRINKSYIIPWIYIGREIVSVLICLYCYFHLKFEYHHGHKIQLQLQITIKIQFIQTGTSLRVVHTQWNILYTFCQRKFDCKHFTDRSAIFVLKIVVLWTHPLTVRYIFRKQHMARLYDLNVMTDMQW